MLIIINMTQADFLSANINYINSTKLLEKKNMSLDNIETMKT